MHSIYVKDVIRICKGKLLCGDNNLELSNFCIDTRILKENDVYVGIKGEKIDGSDFYLDAVKKGASCLILGYAPVIEDIDRNITIIVVEDTLKCIQELACYKRELYDIPVIAVTGSVGKTSTKDLVYSVVAQKYRTHRTIGNYNNHLGVPLTILALQDEEAMVVEMGMNHLGEISVLSKIAKPTISIITNVGTAHIGNLGSRENIRKAKLEILDGMIGNKVIINYDDDMLCLVDEELREKYDLITVSIDKESTYQAVKVREDVFASTFDIMDKTRDIAVNVGGRAYIYNSLVAYAVGEALGIGSDDIKKGIASFKLSSNRLEKKVTKNGITLIDDTYNANFDSMKSSVELVGKVSEKRKIAILGDMLELGEYTDSLHTDLGDVVVNSKIDVLITIGEYSKLIGKRAKELGMNASKIYAFEKEGDSYSFLDDYLNSDDIVLLKGSHGIHLIGIVDYLMK